LPPSPPFPQAAILTTAIRALARTFLRLARKVSIGQCISLATGTSTNESTGVLAVLGDTDRAVMPTFHGRFAPSEGKAPMQWKRFVSRRGLMLVALTVGLAGTAAFADTDVRTRLRSDFEKAVKGKTVAWVPITLGNPLGDSWTAAMRENFDRWGVKFIVRDPNFDSNVELQAVTSLINEKPDVLIVHNPNVSLLAKEIKRAMDSGIYVIQINMRSNQPSDAYVGVDYYDTGRIIAKDIVAECGDGKSSGKVAIVQGEPTAGGSVDQLKGAMEVFATDKSIKVVSTQAANWDSSKANEVTATVLQQHPDLCATYGFWGIMQAGAAQAVKAAGLQGKVKVYASSEGNYGDCDLLEQGLFYKLLSFRSDVQGQQISDAVVTLLESGNKPGSKELIYLSNQYWVTGKQDRRYCFEKGATEAAK
jgi:ribose transport system substrate-binding protein